MDHMLSYLSIHQWPEANKTKCLFIIYRIDHRLSYLSIHQWLSANKTNPIGLLDSQLNLTRWNSYGIKVIVYTKLFKIIIKSVLKN